MGAGYIFCGGRPKAEQCDAGVGFAIRNDIVGGLPCLSQNIKDRLMSPRRPLQGAKFAPVFSVYVPPPFPMASSDEVRNQFCKDLHVVLTIVPKADKLTVLVDFTGLVGTDHAAWEGVLGLPGIECYNSNGLLLLLLLPPSPSPSPSSSSSEPTSSTVSSAPTPSSAL
ncbi:hypothetical protein SprV_0602119600 [Sparganum proliferum]